MAQPRADLRRCPWLRWVVLLACLCVAPAVQSAAPQDTHESDEFQTVTSAAREDVPGVPLLVGAYALFALWIGSYTVRLVLLQRRSRARLERLESVRNGDSTTNVRSTS